MGSQKSYPLVFVLSLFSASALAVNFYVSPDGNDANPGTQEKPFSTLEAARDAVCRTKDVEGATVILKSGRYFRTKTLELDHRDSGTQTHPVIYRGQKKGSVFIDGGKVLAWSACRPVRSAAVRTRFVPEVCDKILEIDLRSFGITNYGSLGPRGFRRAYVPAPLELFINGQAQDIARWPNKGKPHIPVGKVVDGGSEPRAGDYSLRPGIFEYGVERPKRWTQATDVYISGFFHYGFADDTIKLAKIDTENGTFTTILPHLYGFRQGKLSEWFALNLIEEIDVPGEYSIDKESGILYFYPPCDMNNALIQVSMMTEPLVALENASNVYFENITFENSRGTGFYIEKGTNNLIAGCTLRNLGVLAVQIGQGITPFPCGQHNGCGFQASGETGSPISRNMGSWHEYIYRFTAWDRQAGTNHGVLSCDIYDIGAGGISLGGGDRKTLTPAGNFVRNCDIHRVNRLDRTYKAPVNVDGVGNLIQHNHIHHCQGIAIYLHGNDHMIEYNEIDHVLTDMSDQGALYMGRDPSECGNMFRYNFFHDITNPHPAGHSNSALFFDDCSIYGGTIYGNVFYNVGSAGVIRYNGGGEVPVINNIAVKTDCPTETKKDLELETKQVRKFMQNGLGHKRCFENVDISKPPYSIYYPILMNVYAGRNPVTQPAERNYVVADDLSEFVDPANLNFQLKQGSCVYADIPGFVEIPFEKIGLYPDAYRTVLPVSGTTMKPDGVSAATSGKILIAPAIADQGRLAGAAPNLD